MLGGTRREYSWKSSMTMRGHSACTLKDRGCLHLRAGRTLFGPNGLAPAVASPNIDVTVSPTPLYTSQTNSRNGATSDSSDGLKLRMEVEDDPQADERVFLVFRLERSMARPRTSLSCGRKCSLCGSRFIISSTALRVLCSGPSSKCGGVVSSTFWNAGRNAARNAVLGGVHDLDALANRRDQREAILGLVILDQLFACASNWLRARGEGWERSGADRASDFVVLGGKTLLSSPASAHHRTGDPGGSARASIFSNDRRGGVGVACGSTGAYLAFSSVERPPLAGADILPLYSAGSFLGGGEPSHLLRLRRRWRDLYRDRQETRRRARTSRGLRATLKARGVKLALVRRLRMSRPSRRDDRRTALPIRRRSLGSDNLRFDGA